MTIESSIDPSIHQCNGRCTFAVAGPTTRNLFQNNLREPDMQTDCFHRTLKTFLCEQTSSERIKRVIFATMRISKWTSSDAEAQLSVLHDKVNTACDNCISCIKRNLNPKPKHCRPPMNSDMRKLIRRKNRLWIRYIETKDTAKYKEYCMCRNKVRSITRTHRKEFEYQVALRAREEPKKNWNYANSTLKTRSKIPDLYVNAVLTTNDYDKVKVSSDFFASVYVPKSNDELPVLQGNKRSK